MDELPRLDRTWLCSVAFIDIVDYSVQPVALQAAWKERLNRYLGAAIQDVPGPDRVILDTGDGAAVCFLGDPEAAVFCGLRLLGALVEEEPRRESPLRARIGLNLGPVKLVRDINGNLNAIGDGINVGQRVMTFAADNQVLVSRSFYEVASRLSESHVQLFRYLGVRTDKHVREHTVYELLPPGARQHALTTPACEPGPLGASLALPPEVLARIESCLAPVVGPLAHYLVRQAGARASTTGELCQALLQHVPGGPDQERLRNAWETELGEALVSSSSARPGLLIDPDRLAPAARPPTPPAAWEPSVLEQARRALATYLGPVARVIVARAAGRARTEDELYQLIAEEISSPEERQAFLGR